MAFSRPTLIMVPRPRYPASFSMHAGFHEGSVAVFEDCSLKGAVQLERLTRASSATGAFIPMLQSTRSLAPWAPRAVVAMSWRIPHRFPGKYFKGIRGLRWLHQQYHSSTQIPALSTSMSAK